MLLTKESEFSLCWQLPQLLWSGCRAPCGSSPGHIMTSCWPWRGVLLGVVEWNVGHDVGCCQELVWLVGPDVGCHQELVWLVGHDVGATKSWSAVLAMTWNCGSHHKVFCHMSAVTRMEPINIMYCITCWTSRGISQLLVQRAGSCQPFCQCCRSEHILADSVIHLSIATKAS